LLIGLPNALVLALLAGFGEAVPLLLVLVVLWQFRMVVVYVLISLALAAALRPLVNRFVGRGFMGRLAWIMLYLVVLVSFGFLLLLTMKIAIKEIQQFSQTVSVQDAWRLPAWLDGSAFQQVLVRRLPPPGKLFEAATGDQGQLVLPALLIALQQKGLKVVAEKPIEVTFRGQGVGQFYADLLIEDTVIVELKAVAALSPEHKAQLINYLKATGIEVGLLVNFGNSKLEYRRLHK
jgi:GxxExxY protein